MRGKPDSLPPMFFAISVEDRIRVDQSLRHCLVHGVSHPLPDRLARPAA